MLVAIDSRNPALDDDAPGEGECARALAEVLTEWGFRVELQETSKNRPNVIGRIGSTRLEGHRALLLNGHLDTVGVQGMVHAPWDPVIRDGRLYGRGSADMKAGVASMCAAAVLACDAGMEGEVILAAVTDEEFHSAGTLRLLKAGIRADAAIVAEPTCLAICPAHRGFAWLDLVVHGRAAHGSRWDVGVDAIALAAMVMTELEQYQTDSLAKKTHPLLGRPSLHASLVSGGIGLSTYPDLCRIQLERRTIPGETPELFTREVQEACERVRTRRPELRAEVIPGVSQEPNDVHAASPIVRALEASINRLGQSARVEGLSCWTDAALLSAAGIPAVCFGPGDIAVAHAAEEYVPVAEVERATLIMTSVIRDWFGRGA